ncbi:MAG: hypothetical protein UH851_02980 [Clostridia bacterium]|nr:hypothetical protein [Clostridia bacterium]MEE1115805.1 hypothetical protein [Clostridia bacterium]
MKRITLFAGHYGSGKTNIAVNYALQLRKALGRDKDILVADLDIVNPYFRTKDSCAVLQENGIKLICSEYANSNLDIPSLPSEMYAITDTPSYAVIDVGGDDRGALALGRLSAKIKAENNYENLMVINMFRPLTRTPDQTVEVMREIEAAGNIPFTALVNNSNLGPLTSADDILRSLEYAEKISRLTGLEVKMTSVDARLFESLQGKVEDLFSLTLQPKIF